MRIFRQRKKILLCDISNIIILRHRASRMYLQDVQGFVSGSITEVFRSLPP